MDAVSKEIVDELGSANFQNVLMSSKHVFSCRSSWYKNLEHAQRALVVDMLKTGRLNKDVNLFMNLYISNC